MFKLPLEQKSHLFLSPCCIFQKQDERKTKEGNIFQRLRVLAQHRSVMARRIYVLLLLLLHLAVLLLGLAAGVGRIRKKAVRTRSCVDLPEEILEQMFGRLSVGVLSAFHHALQLEPQQKLNLTCPTTSRSLTDSKTRLPVSLRSISPWTYR